MPALFGESANPSTAGVEGNHTGGGDGVVGRGIRGGRGVFGEGPVAGVVGSGQKVGVEGTSEEVAVHALGLGSGTAVLAEADRGVAVDAKSRHTAVLATSSDEIAVKAESDYIAIQAFSDRGVAVAARGGKHAGYFVGDVKITKGLEVKGIEVMPGPTLRRLTITGSLTLRDDEDLATDEFETVALPAADVSVGTLHEVVHHIEAVCGGEVRLELDIFASVGMAGSIMVNVDARLYEGDTDTTNDLDGRGIYALQVPADDIRSLQFTVHNEDEDVTDDQGFASLAFANH